MAPYGVLWLSGMTQRRESWSLLRNLCNRSTLSCCVIGDFNDLLSTSDKKGSNHHPQWLYSCFCSAVLDCGLTDLPLLGYPSTWERGKGLAAYMEERLDRALVSSSWILNFPHAQLHNSAVSISDHSPIVLNTNPFIQSVVSRNLRFENKWFNEPDLHAFVNSIDLG